MSQGGLADGLARLLCDEEIRLFLVGGKGGVGKTTVAVALSLRLADMFPARRFLLVSTDPAHSLSDVLGFPLTPTAPLYNRPKLFGLEIDAEKVWADFKGEYGRALKSILEHGTYLDDEDVSRLLELSFPGLDEVMAMVRIMDLLATGEYDALIVDTAPTGHTLRLLSLPLLMDAWVSILNRMMEKHRFMSRIYGGAYRKSTEDEFIEMVKQNTSRILAILQNETVCRFVPVTLLEPMILAETERLLMTLQQRRIFAKDLLINQVLLRENSCITCMSMFRGQQQCLKKLMERYRHLRMILFPAFRHEVRGEKALRCFVDRAFCLQEVGGMRGSSGRLKPSGGKPVPLSVDCNRQFFLFCGKGGVGKTTLSASFALHLSREYGEKKILLFSTDPAHSLSDCLAQNIGPREVRIKGTDNLFAMEIDADRLFEQWKQSYRDQVEEFFERFSGQAGIDLRFDREVLANLLDLTPPGLDELMALSELAAFVEQGRYDLYILDCAPTGHTLRFLELPGLVKDWLVTFFEILLKYRNILRLPSISRNLVEISSRIRKIRLILADPTRCEAVPVASPTLASMEETRRLLTALGSSGVAVKRLLVNRMVTMPNDCPSCRTLARRHQSVLRRYQKHFRDLEIIPFPQWTGRLQGRDILLGLLKLA